MTFLKFKTMALLACALLTGNTVWAQTKQPVDYVNPYIGNISHLLVPTFATVQLPNSMLRVYPARACDRDKPPRTLGVQHLALSRRQPTAGGGIDMGQ